MNRSPEAVQAAQSRTEWKREIAVAATIFVLAALLFTWPLARQLTSAIPTGPAPPTVALFGLFTVEWTGQVLEQGRPYWDAPIFHPHGGTFAWSEAQPFTSFVVWLASKAFGTILAYNLVLIAYLVMAGLAGYALARQLTDDSVAAMWAGLWLTAGAFTIQQLAVLHLLAGAFPIAFLALILVLMRRPTIPVACAAAIAYFLTFMTCAQFGLFLSILLPVFLAPLVFRRGWTWKHIATVFAPIILGPLLALPFLLTQRSHLAEMGFQRSLGDVVGAYSPTDLILPARGHWLTSKMLELSESPGAYPWDLGVVFLVCLLGAGACVRFRFRDVDPSQLRQRAAVLMMSIAALLLGFGLKLGVTVDGTRMGPYLWLRSVVPGLEGVRTPARFGLFAIVGTAVLAAVAFAFLRRRANTRSSRFVLTTAAFGLLLAEMWAVPVALVDADHGIEDHGEVLAWLQQHGEGEPLLELPMAQGDGVADLESSSWAIRRALRHGNPIVNGYSGHFPETYRQVRGAVRTDLAGRGRRYLDALGVRHVLVHDHNHELSRREQLAEALRGQVVFDTDRDLVIRLVGGLPALTAEPVPTTQRFRNEPKPGALLGYPIEPATDRARLVVPPAGRLYPFSWTDRFGDPQTREIHLRGSVLLDSGRRWLYVFVQRAPTADRPGIGVLLSEERLQPRARPSNEKPGT